MIVNPEVDQGVGIACSGDWLLTGLEGLFEDAAEEPVLELGHARHVDVVGDFVKLKGS